MPIISIVDDQELLNFCKIAHEACTGWFGTPDDEDWPTELFRMKSAKCYRIARSKKYIITTCNHYKTSYQYKATIGHEIYHRVTALYPEMKKNVWVDEMLAYLTSRQLLLVIGLETYSNYRDSIILQSFRKMDIEALKLYKKHKTIFFSRSHNAPFYNTASTLGIELMHHLEWVHICQLVHSKSPEEWLLSLPIEKRHVVSKILDI